MEATFKSKVDMLVAIWMANEAPFMSHKPEHMRHMSIESWKIYSTGRYQTRCSIQTDKALATAANHFNWPCLLSASTTYEHPRLIFQRVMEFIRNWRAFSARKTAEKMVEFILSLKEAHIGCSRLSQMAEGLGCKRSSELSERVIRILALYAAVYISWSADEAAAFIVSQGMGPGMTTPQSFMRLLSDEIEVQFSITDKINRRFLVHLLANLDKLLVDRIYTSSINQLGTVPLEVEKYITSTRLSFCSWLLKCRQPLARLSLIVDDPADCWRNISARLDSDLASKFSSLSLTRKGDELCGSFIDQDLTSLKAQNWQMSLNLLAQSAKQLRDLPLMYGVRTLSEYKGIISKPQSLALIIGNIEGEYSQVCDMFKSIQQPEESSVVEFLNSCIELGTISEHESQISLLKSTRSKELYQRYLNSASEMPKLQESSGSPSDRVGELYRWLSNWHGIDTKLNSSQPFDRMYSQAMQSYVDLIVPTCLNVMAKEKNCDSNKLKKMISSTQWFMERDFMAQCLFPPSHLNDNTKVYQFLLDFLGTRRLKPLNESVIDAHHKNYRWNHLLLRLLRDMNLIEELRSKQPQTIDLIQIRAAKFNLRNNNLNFGTKIIEDMIGKSSSQQHKHLGALLIARFARDDSEETKLNKFCDLALDYKSIQAVGSQKKNDFTLKILRNIIKNTQDLSIVSRLEPALFQDYWKSTRTVESSGEKVSSFGLGRHWDHCLMNSSRWSRIRTLKIYADKLKTTLKPLLTVKSFKQAKSAKDFPPSFDPIMKDLFRLNLLLLVELSQSSRIPLEREERKLGQMWALECAANILDCVRTHWPILRDEDLALFKSNMRITLNVWISLRRTLISVILHDRQLSEGWRTTFICLVKLIVRAGPASFVYETLVSRLDLKRKLDHLCKMRAGRTDTNQLSLANLLIYNNLYLSSVEDPESLINDYQNQMSFWDQIHKEILQLESLIGVGMSGGSSIDRTLETHKMMSETGKFVEQLEKISFLPSEYMKLVVFKLNKKVHDLFMYCTSLTGDAGQAALPLVPPTEEQRNKELSRRFGRMMQDLKSVRLLKLHADRELDTPTLYDQWFRRNFSEPLGELQRHLSKLRPGKEVPQSEVRKVSVVAAKILKVISVVYNQVVMYHHEVIYMQMINPKLSKLAADSSILMPSFHHDDRQPALGVDHWKHRMSERPITVARVHQTVETISSLTNPKKISLLGSDGGARSYLLKSHDDLRLDQLMTDVFSAINIILAGHKQTRGQQFRIRNYSVTPLGPRCGLIQWIEAPAFTLDSIWRRYLMSDSGHKMVADLFGETCDILCESACKQQKHKKLAVRVESPDKAKAKQQQQQQREHDKEAKRATNSSESWGSPGSQGPSTSRAPKRNKNKSKCEPPSAPRSTSLFYQLLWAQAKATLLNSSSGTEESKQQLVQTKPSAANMSKYRSEFEPVLFEQVLLQLSHRVPRELVARHLWLCSTNSHAYWLRTKEFIRSYATMSIVGYLVGLGDRHTGNILLNSRTGQVTHVDLTMSFELAQFLSTPEQVPFRLTQNIVTAFGFAGLEGNFVVSCCKILRALRDHNTTLSHNFDPVNLHFMLAVGNQRPVDKKRDFIQAEVAARLAAELREAAQQEGSSESTQSNETIVSQVLDDSPHSRAAGSLSRELDLLELHIKTQTKISADHASKAYERFRAKLTGFDENIRHHKMQNEPFGLGVASVAATAGGDQLVHLGESSAEQESKQESGQKVEDQVDALIQEALAVKNKAKMYEGWQPWF